MRALWIEMQLLSVPVHDFWSRPVRALWIEMYGTQKSVTNLNIVEAREGLVD